MAGTGTKRHGVVLLDWHTYSLAGGRTRLILQDGLFCPSQLNTGKGGDATRPILLCPHVHQTQTETFIRTELNLKKKNLFRPRGKILYVAGAPCNNGYN